MTIRERLHAEIDRLDEQKLEQLEGMIQQLDGSDEAGSEPRGVLSRLREIRIEGPSDFSENLDAYMNGEKPLAPHSDVRRHGLHHRPHQRP